MNEDLLPIKGKARRYLNLFVALVLVAGTITLIMRGGSQLPSDSSPDPASAPLFRVGEQAFGYEELAPEFQEPLYQIRKMAHEQQMLVLEQALVENYIRQQMTRQGLDREAVLQQLFPKAVPSAAELEDFYRANRTPDTPPFGQIRGQIEDYLTEQSREELKKSLLARLLVEGKAEMLIEAPRPPQHP